MSNFYSRALAASTDTPAHGISFADAVRVWLKISLLSFGGPAGQIAVMHRILVDEKRWISERRFLHALNYCMLLPGPEAQQLVTYIGWLLHRTLGGLVAGTLFVLPGFIVILGLSILYAGYYDVSFVQALFFGLKPAVLAVVVHAGHRIGGRVLKNRIAVTIAVGAFIGLFLFDVPFPLIIVAAAIFGYVGNRIKPDLLVSISRDEKDSNASVDAILSDGVPEHTRPSFARALRITAVCLTLWLGPILVLAMVLGPTHLYTQMSLFFSKVAVVTFGGAYAVLAYVAQQAVDAYGWLQPGEMLDGLGMAETTPGPLIMVLQFVGFMAAFRDPGGLEPMLAGALAAMLTTWVTFVPCFLWIFLGAPYIETLRGNASLNSAMSGISAAVVGVIASLAVWFVLHVVFANLEEVRALGASIPLPVWSSIDLASLVLAVAALMAIFRYKVGIIPTLIASAVLGMAYRLAI